MRDHVRDAAGTERDFTQATGMHFTGIKNACA